MLQIVIAAPVEPLESFFNSATYKRKYDVDKIFFMSNLIHAGIAYT